MKALLQLLGNLVFAVSTAVGIFVVAAGLTGPEPEPHHFKGLYAAGLWTSEPTRVDPGTQNLERLPGPVVAAALQKPRQQMANATSAVKVREVASLDPTAGMEGLQSADLTGAPAPAAPAMDVQALAAHVNWCMQHYRSYDQGDNSYRAYSGERRTCRSPYVAALEAGMEPVSDIGEDPVAAAPAVVAADDHVRSCMQRYRSYRPADNTYQPFDGGPRRQCH